MSPPSRDCAIRWRALSAEIMAGIEEWRLHHPKAALREIEAAVDEWLAEWRTRMRQEVALASQATDVRQAHARDRPVCPPCRTPGEPRGPRER